MNWRAAWIGFLFATPAAAQQGPRLEPLFHASGKEGRQIIVARANLSKNAERPTPAFFAVISSTWPAGLVPVFALEEERPFELRRIFPRGQEGMEPLFFALPPEDEPQATNIAGRWSCSATNAQGHRHYPEWELAIDGERLAGRFAPEGEYRVAFITSGTFRSNRFELNVEYINDHYLLQGEWRAGKLAGTWQQRDDDSHGVWEATRAAPMSSAAADVVPLYEWRRGNERRYSVEPKPDFKEGGWERAARPLCRVWQLSK